MARIPKGDDGSRNVTMSIRVTPKMRFNLEMMARLHRDTIPNIVTRAINNVFSSEFEGLWDYGGTISEVGYLRPLDNCLWAERASDRLANIAFNCDRLLTSSDVRLWSYIKAQPRFWREQVPQTEKGLLRDVLASEWDAIQEANQSIEEAKLMGSTPTTIEAVVPVASPVKSKEPATVFSLFKQKVLSQKTQSRAQSMRNGRELQKLVRILGWKNAVHSVTANAAGTVIAYIEADPACDVNQLCSGLDEILDGHIRAEPA